MQHIRYQLTEHMHRLSQADYYTAFDTETQRRVTVCTIDVSTPTRSTRLPQVSHTRFSMRTKTIRRPNLPLPILICKQMLATLPSILFYCI